MKKLTLKNKLVTCGILGTLSLGLLMGASTQETNYDLDTLFAEEESQRD